jgi:nucleotide-binding universal stress UspA family protein
MGDAQHRRLLGSILVATDCSAGAHGALERAARLPLSLGSSLEILHVLTAGLDPEHPAYATNTTHRATFHGSCPLLVMV